MTPHRVGISIHFALFVLAGIGICIGLVGCERETEAGPGESRFRSDTGSVPASPQRSGDPTAGYRALVNEPYESCGIPYDAYRRLIPETSPEDQLPGRKNRNAELPYYQTAHTNTDGIEVVSANCLVCHAARFDGKLILGLGNEFLDFTQDPRDFVNEVGIYVRGEAATAAWQRWADRIAGIAPYIQTKTVGVNPATNLTWALMAHRDPETLAWSSESIIELPPRDPLPVSVPPWWRMKYKNAMFYTSLGRGDHARLMMLAGMLCVESVEEAKAIDTYAPDIRAYIANLDAPEYPFPIDKTLALEGQEVFERHCSQCHGTYGDDRSYPDRVIGLEEIGTDPEYALAATDGRRDRFYEWLHRSYYGETARAAPARGYIAPPLDGVWATAPYLHNGSVPDIATLLTSETRPRYWRHRDNPRSYDPKTLGWRYEVLSHGKSSKPDADSRIYDTTLTGYGNEGHTYGDTLTGSERQAVIEYLKTL